MSLTYKQRAQLDGWAERVRIREERDAQREMMRKGWPSFGQRKGNRRNFSWAVIAGVIGVTIIAFLTIVLSGK